MYQTKLLNILKQLRVPYDVKKRHLFVPMIDIFFSIPQSSCIPLKIYGYNFTPYMWFQIDILSRILYCVCYNKIKSKQILNKLYSLYAYFHFGLTLLGTYIVLRYIQNPTFYRGNVIIYLFLRMIERYIKKILV